MPQRSGRRHQWPPQCQLLLQCGLLLLLALLGSALPAATAALTHVQHQPSIKTGSNVAASSTASNAVQTPKVRQAGGSSATIKGSAQQRGLFVNPLGQRVQPGGLAWAAQDAVGIIRQKSNPISLQSLSEGHGPNGMCAPECTRYGVCNQELGRCDCPRGFQGPDCRQPMDVARICKETHFHHYKGNCTDSKAIIDNGPIVCINGCNGRGKCRAGWCHCRPGYWGADCSLSMDPEGKVEVLVGTNYTPRRKRPLIYVYDLPPRLNTWRNPHASDRPLHILFWQRLLPAGVVTANGEEADYFFFPMNVRGPSDGLLLEAAVEYVRKYWPYWDRYQGARHLVMHTGDTGRAELAGRTLRMTANCTFLTHWGLWKDYPYSGWPASHIKDRDIVVPVFLSPTGARAAGLQLSPHHPKSTTRFSTTRDVQLLFAGRICGGRDEPDGTKVPNCKPVSQGYSQGVRQQVHQHHWNRTGFRITNGANPNYFNDLMRTRFCLAPAGGGHGHRQILVAFSGCTPLIISDYVYQPFEPAMNWTRFAVTVPQSDIPNLHNVLPSIPEERFQQMQAALPCAAQHFTWSSGIGSFMHEDGRYDAFETTLEILRMGLKYPGVPHEQYEAIDPEYKAFMECRSEQYVASQPTGAAVNRPRAAKPRPLPPKKAQTEASSFFGMGSKGGWVLKPAGSQDGKVTAVRATRRFGPRLGASNPLCSISKWDQVPLECEPCLVKYRRLPPGGALCCGLAHNLTACARLWE